jgi:hypothetical protein
VFPPPKAKSGFSFRSLLKKADKEGSDGDDSGGLKFKATIEMGVTSVDIWGKFDELSEFEVGAKLTLLKVLSIELKLTFALGLGVIIEPCAANGNSIIVGFDPSFTIGATVEGGVDIADGVLGGGVGMDLNFFELHIPLTATFSTHIYKIPVCPTTALNLAVATNMYVLSGRFYIWFKVLKVFKVVPVEICWPKQNAWYQTTDPTTMKPTVITSNWKELVGTAKKKAGCNNEEFTVAPVATYLLQDPTWSSHARLTEVTNAAQLKKLLAQNAAKDGYGQAKRTVLRDFAVHFFLAYGDSDTRLQVLNSLQEIKTDKEIYAQLLLALTDPKKAGFEQWHKFAAKLAGKHEKEFSFPAASPIVHEALVDLTTSAVGKAKAKWFASGAWNKVKSVASSAWHHVKSWASKAASWVKDTAVKLVKLAAQIQKKYNDFMNAIASYVKKAWDAIANFCNSFFTACGSDGGAGWVYAGEFVKFFKGLCFKDGVTDPTKGYNTVHGGNYMNFFKEKFGKLNLNPMDMFTSCTPRDCLGTARVFQWNVHGAKCLPNNPCKTMNSPCAFGSLGNERSGRYMKCVNTRTTPWPLADAELAQSAELAQVQSEAGANDKGQVGYGKSVVKPAVRPGWKCQACSNPNKKVKPKDAGCTKMCHAFNRPTCKVKKNCVQNCVAKVAKGCKMTKVCKSKLICGKGAKSILVSATSTPLGKGETPPPDAIVVKEEKEDDKDDMKAAELEQVGYGPSKPSAEVVAKVAAYKKRNLEKYKKAKEGRAAIVRKYRKKHCKKRKSCIYVCKHKRSQECHKKCKPVKVCSQCSCRQMVRKCDCTSKPVCWDYNANLKCGATAYSSSCIASKLLPIRSKNAPRL